MESNQILPDKNADLVTIRKKIILSSIVLIISLIFLIILNVPSFISSYIKLMFFPNTQQESTFEALVSDSQSDINEDIEWPSKEDMGIWYSVNSLVKNYIDQTLTQDIINENSSINYDIGSVTNIDSDQKSLTFKIFFSPDQTLINTEITINPDFTQGNTSILGYNPDEEQDIDGFNNCYFQDEIYIEEPDFLEIEPTDSTQNKVFSCLKEGNILAVFKDTSEKAPFSGSFYYLIHE